MRIFMRRSAKLNENNSESCKKIPTESFSFDIMDLWGTMLPISFVFGGNE